MAEYVVFYNGMCDKRYLSVMRHGRPCVTNHISLAQRFPDRGMAVEAAKECEKHTGWCWYIEEVDGGAEK